MCFIITAVFPAISKKARSNQFWKIQKALFSCTHQYLLDSSPSTTHSCGSVRNGRTAAGILGLWQFPKSPWGQQLCFSGGGVSSVEGGLWQQPQVQGQSPVLSRVACEDQSGAQPKRSEVPSRKTRVDHAAYGPEKTVKRFQGKTATQEGCPLLDILSKNSITLLRQRPPTFADLTPRETKTANSPKKPAHCSPFSLLAQLRMRRDNGFESTS